jgi:hypothetical protein
MDPSKLKGASKQMYDSMNEQQLRDFAKKAYWSDLHARYPWLKAGGVAEDLADDRETEAIRRKLRKRKSKRVKQAEKNEAPDYRMAGDSEDRCGNCQQFEASNCTKYDFTTDPQYVCDAFTQDPQAEIDPQPKGGQALAEQMKLMPVPDEQKMAFVRGFVTKCGALKLSEHRLRTMIVAGTYWPGQAGDMFRKLAQGLGAMNTGGLKIAPQPKPNIQPPDVPTAGTQLAAAPSPAAQAPKTMPGQPGAAQPTTMPAPVANAQPRPLTAKQAQTPQLGGGDTPAAQPKDKEKALKAQTAKAQTSLAGQDITTDVPTKAELKIAGWLKRLINGKDKRA